MGTTGILFSATKIAGLRLDEFPSKLIDAETPPTPPVDVVPGFGCLSMTQCERDTVASYVLAMHRVDSGLLVLRLAWPPVAVNHDRRCGWCRNPWPCAAAEWAHTVRAQTAIGYAL